VARSLTAPHAHMNLLGWLSFFVYGVGYHILPRFRGTPLYSERLAVGQMYLANISLVGMVIFWIIWINGGGVTFQAIWGVAAGLQALAAYIFVYNLTRTFLRKSA
ncbi:MAG: hypothetical protein M1358_00040, partial [Chloroflexi bacterium]|nr:hypothetical protein [Chloroflexota bacterium]